MRGLALESSAMSACSGENAKWRPSLSSFVHSAACFGKLFDLSIATHSVQVSNVTELSVLQLVNDPSTCTSTINHIEMKANL